MAVRWAIVPRSARARSPAAESSKCGIGAWDQSGNARFHIVYIYVCVYTILSISDLSVVILLYIQLLPWYL